MAKSFRYEFWVTALVILLFLTKAFAQEKCCVPAVPAQLAPHYVKITRLLPLRPGMLNLFGYEFNKQAQAGVILSPDKQLMAATELYFVPDISQTNSRIDILMVGPIPALDSIVSVDELAKIQKQKHDDSQAIPQVDLDHVNPQPFWDRYIPAKQLTSRQVVLDAGFDVLKRYRLDILQVVDWSQTGRCLLAIYRPGLYHLGIYRTLPLVYDRSDNNIVDLAFLPGLIWKASTADNPGLRVYADKTWDIRVLGWSRQDPDALIAKLVLFDGQSRYPLNYWSYNWQSGVLKSLGTNLDSSAIARNGWEVRLVDPNATGGPHVYAPGEIPPASAIPEAVYAPAKGPGKFDRLRFWQK